MDPETGEISPKKIVDYYNNGETDEWLQFEVAAGGGLEQDASSSVHRTT